MAGKFSDNIRALGGSLGGIAKGLGENLKKADEAARPLATGLRKIQTQAKGAAEGFVTAREKAQKLNDELKKATEKSAEESANALNKLRDSLDKTAAGAKAPTEKLRTFHEELEKSHVEANVSAIEKIGKAYGRLSSSLSGLLSSPLVGFLRSATGAVLDFAADFEQAAGQIEDTANALGITSQQLQSLQYAAEQSGVASEQLTAGLRKLQAISAQAARGNEQHAQTFRALSVTLRDSNGELKNVSQLSDEIAVALGNIEDPAQATALSVKLFGESGARMLQVLKSGEGGLADFRKEFARLGGGVSDEAIGAAGAYGDQLNRLNIAVDSLRSTLAVALIPTLTAAATWLTNTAAAILSVIRQSNAMRAAMIVLGAVLVAVGVTVLATWGPVIALFLGIAAGIAAVVLIVDDLITLFEGGDSAIGRLIDSLFGIGTARAVVATLSNAYNTFTKQLRIAAFEVRKFVADNQTLISVLRAIFSTIIDTGVTAISGLVTSLRGAFAVVSETFSIMYSAFSVLGSVFSFVKDNITSVIETVFPLQSMLADLTGSLAAFTGNTLGNIRGPASTGFESIGQTIRNAAVVKDVKGSNAQKTTVSSVVNAPVTIQATNNAEATASAVARRLQSQQTQALQSALASIPGRSAG